ncbi:MAG: VOC family protein [Micromonosporaceae bacterium]|nr:VOC family protein [Micromonosporaceae bacterium]
MNSHIVGVYARLVVSEGAAAIDFYRAALGATEVARYTNPAGKIVHAELDVAGTTIALKDEGDGDLAPATLGGTPVIIALQVDDADAVAGAMLAAGATVIYPVADQPHGERGGRLADPFGHQWMISQQIEDLTAAEVQRRVDGMAGG